MAADQRLPRVLAVCALVAVGATLAYLAGGPIFTDDAWFHLKMGEAYATLGPWPGADPLLHTARPEAPIQHEWLFGVALWAWHELTGFMGLRVLHAASALGIVLLALRIAAQRTRRLPLAAAATVIFVVLAWWRLVQLRPDLVSIAATLALYTLALAPGRPAGRRDVALAVVLLVVWANMHSLFAVGLALVVAAALGDVLEAMLARGLRIGTDLPGEVPARLRRRLGLLVLGSIATVANPRGLEQHLTFFRSSLESNIWVVRDEWAPFHPFRWNQYGLAGNALTWGTADALAVAFAVAAGWGAVRLLRRRDVASLRAFDPVGLGLGLAAMVAALVSVRFLWLGFFVALYGVRVLADSVRAAAAAPGWGRHVPASAAALALVGALAWPAVGGIRAITGMFPESARAYLTTPYVTDKYYVEGVRFLLETGVDGRLFNNYWMGGFLGYWLAPRLRTYVDARIEHYPKDVSDEVPWVSIGRSPIPGERAEDVLERRGVDFFFGVGYPPGAGASTAGVFSVPVLERSPGWIPVSRSVRHAIYLRTAPRNAENLRRIEAWYRAAGVPFDAERGVDASAVVARAPAWAAHRGLLPRHWRELEAGLDAPDDEARFAAHDMLGLVHALLASYVPALGHDRAAAALQPHATGPRLRMVYELLRLERTREARRVAEALAREAPDEPAARAAVAVTTQLERALAEAVLAGPGSRPDEPPQLVVSRLPWFRREDYARIRRDLDFGGPLERSQRVRIVRPGREGGS